MMRFTARKRRAVRAASIMRRASAIVVASGFSQSTCLPASSAAIASSLCVEGGVAMWMICTSSRAASAWNVRADRHGKFLARLARGLRDRVGNGGCAQPRRRGKLAQAEAAKCAAPEQSYPEFRARYDRIRRPRCFSFSRCFHGVGTKCLGTLKIACPKDNGAAVI